VRYSRAVARLLACSCTIVLLSLPLDAAGGQSHWDRYKVGTLTAIIRAQGPIILANESLVPTKSSPKHPGYHYSGDDYPTRAVVVYKGDSRPIDPNRREILRRWGLALRRDTTVADNFTREYLFQEGDQALWLPVQDTVASYFPKELKPGQVVTLYAMFVGAYYAGKEITWTFIVNEFDAQARGNQ
jgi:hypothetical protein